MSEQKMNSTHRLEPPPKQPSSFLDHGITRKEKSFHIQTQNSLGNTAEIHDNLLQKVECIAEQNEYQSPNVPSAISWYEFKIPKVLSGSIRNKVQAPPNSNQLSNSNPYKAPAKHIQPPGYPKLVIHNNMETLHSFMKETNSFRRTAINSPPRHSRMLSYPTRMEHQQERKVKENRPKSTLLTSAHTPTDSIMAKYAPEMGYRFKEAFSKQTAPKVQRKEISPVKKQIDTFFSILERKRILASKVPLLVTGADNRTIDPKIIQIENPPQNERVLRGIRANRTMSSSSSLFNEDLIDLDIKQSKQNVRAPFKIEVPTVSPILHNIPPSVRSGNRPSTRSVNMTSNVKKGQIVKTGGGRKKIQKSQI